MTFQLSEKPEKKQKQHEVAQIPSQGLPKDSL